MSDYAGATVVAFHGPKPPALEQWLSRLLGVVASAVPGFEARPLEQIHATVVGLEFPLRAVTGADVTGLGKALATQLPMPGRFGGERRGFLSRGLPPAERVFSGAGGRAVVIGWLSPPEALIGIRRSAEPFGFRHRYHENPADQDLDLYMVIGTCSEPGPIGASVVRDDLLSGSLTFDLRPEDVAFVRYSTTTLAIGSSRRLPLDLSSEDADAIAADVNRGC